MKQIALILKARAYRYAIPGPRRSILIFNPKHDHSPQSCISQRGYNIELSRPADLREAATVQRTAGAPSIRWLRGRLQRLVMFTLSETWQARKQSVFLLDVPYLIGYIVSTT